VEEYFFTSRHEVKLDERSRSVIPSPYRKENPNQLLGAEFMVTPHADGYLMIRPISVFKKMINDIIEKVNQLPPEKIEDASKKAKNLGKLLYAHSQKITLDGKHRIILSPEMRSKLKFSKPKPREDVILIGRGSYFEILPKELDKYEEESLQSLSIFLDDFGEGTVEGVNL